MPTRSQSPRSSINSTSSLPRCPPLLNFLFPPLPPLKHKRSCWLARNFAGITNKRLKTNDPKSLEESKPVNKKDLRSRRIIPSPDQVEEPDRAARTSELGSVFITLRFAKKEKISSGRTSAKVEGSSRKDQVFTARIVETVKIVHVVEPKLETLTPINSVGSSVTDSRSSRISQDTIDPNLPSRKINPSRDYCRTTRSRLRAVKQWIDSIDCPTVVKYELYRWTTAEVLKLAPQDRINEELSKEMGESLYERQDRHEEELDEMIAFFEDVYLAELSLKEYDRRFRAWRD